MRFRVVFHWPCSNPLGEAVTAGFGPQYQKAVSKPFQVLRDRLRRNQEIYNYQQYIGRLQHKKYPWKEASIRFGIRGGLFENYQETCISDADKTRI